MTKIAKSIQVVFVLLCLLTGSACSYEPLTITGNVVDESGNALSGVSVWACYSGWGWGEEEGYLVWDKNYCSETTLTDDDGFYSITYEGPISSFLRARKDGWVQAGSFHAENSRIVMITNEDNSARLRDEAKQRDLEQCRRQAMETDTSYYCRAVLPETRSVNLNYQDEVIAVTPKVLEGAVQNEAIFAVQGASRAVDAFSREVVLMINGEVQDLHFLIEPGDSGCSQDLHLLEFRVPNLDLWVDAKFDLYVPSIKAMFEVNLHACSAD